MTTDSAPFLMRENEPVMPVGEDGEYAAHTLRNLHLGTDYPDVAWQDAPESERSAWMVLAGLLKEMPPEGPNPGPKDREALHRQIQWMLSGASAQTAVVALLDSLAVAVAVACGNRETADRFLDQALPAFREGLHKNWPQMDELRDIAEAFVPPPAEAL